jgi:hypothetical protein
MTENTKDELKKELNEVNKFMKVMIQVDVEVRNKLGGDYVLDKLSRCEELLESL